MNNLRNYKEYYESDIDLSLPKETQELLKDIYSTISKTIKNILEVKLSKEFFMTTSMDTILHIYPGKDLKIPSLHLEVFTEERINICFHNENGKVQKTLSGKEAQEEVINYVKKMNGT